MIQEILTINQNLMIRKVCPFKQGWAAHRVSLQAG